MIRLSRQFRQQYVPKWVKPKRPLDLADLSKQWHADVAASKDKFNRDILPALDLPEQPIRLNIDNYEARMKHLQTELDELEMLYEDSKDTSLLDEYGSTRYRIRWLEKIKGSLSHTGNIASCFESDLATLALDACPEDRIMTTLPGLAFNVKQLVNTVYFNQMRKALGTRTRQIKHISERDQKYFNILTLMLNLHQFEKFKDSYTPKEPTKIHLSLPSIPTRESVQGTARQNMLFKPAEKKSLMKLHANQIKSIVNTVRYFDCDTIVYTTASTATTHNDNLIEHAAHKIGIDCSKKLLVDEEFHRTLEDLFSTQLNFESVKFGSMIYPTLDKNHGPVYISRLKIAPL